MKSYRSQRFALGRAVVALLLFGLAFGYVEAAVVVYLRGFYEPLHQRIYPEVSATDLFPILRLDHLETAGSAYLHRLQIELVREAATLLMLAAVALAVARNLRQWLASFMIAFGVWDIFFYAFLRVLIGWPASLFDWDLLFLLPVPWVGPVVAPVLVALSMIAAGVILLRREAAGRPVRMGWGDWLAAIVAACIIIVAFCWDYRHILAGGAPESFNWPLFIIGLALGWRVFLHTLNGPERVKQVSRATISEDAESAELVEKLF